MNGLVFMLAASVVALGVAANAERLETTPIPTTAGFTTADPTRAPPQCRTVAGIIASFERKTIPSTVLDSSLRWSTAKNSDGPKGQSVTPNRVDEISGLCAPYLEGVSSGNFQFSTGITVSESSQGFTAWRPGTVFGNTSYSTEPHPDIPTATFVMAAEAEKYVKGQRAGLYMGLWKSINGWALASFARCKGGRFTRPNSVLISHDQIEGLTYFPAPDISAGGLYFLMDRRNNSKWLIKADWMHKRGAEELCGDRI